MPTFHSIACMWPWLSMFSLVCVCFTVTYAVAGDVLMFVIHIIACMWPWLSMLSLVCVCFTVTYAVASDVLMFVIRIIACVWPWLSMLYSYSLACVCYNWPNRQQNAVSCDVLVFVCRCP